MAYRRQVTLSDALSTAIELPVHNQSDQGKVIADYLFHIFPSRINISELIDSDELELLDEAEYLTLIGNICSRDHWTVADVFESAYRFFVIEEDIGEFIKNVLVKGYFSIEWNTSNINDLIYYLCKSNLNCLWIIRTVNLAKLYNEDRLLNEYILHYFYELQFKDAGYVYLLSNPAFQQDLYKIGYTTDIKRRLKDLYRTNIPARYEVKKLWAVRNCAVVENILHNKLFRRRYNLDREFFVFDDMNVMQIINEIEQLLTEDSIIGYL